METTSPEITRSQEMGPFRQALKFLGRIAVIPFAIATDVITRVFEIGDNATQKRVDSIRINK